MQSENSFSEFIVSLNKDFSKENLNSVIGNFISEYKTSGNIDDNGLMALYFVSLFGEKLSHDRSSQLGEIVKYAVKENKDKGDLSGGIVGETLAASRLLRQQVREYFRISQMPFDYFKINPLAKPLANNIIKLESQKISNVYNQEFIVKGNIGSLTEAFDVEGVGIGIWMSKQGVKFDPSRVDK